MYAAEDAASSADTIFAPTLTGTRSAEQFIAHNFFFCRSDLRCARTASGSFFLILRVESGICAVEPDIDALDKFVRF
jgi:hypothetical protein